jgi:calcineurin-like phosphoesterase family protein
VDEMNDTIISNHNSLVAPSDTVYFLGDIILGQRHEVDAILPQLNGHKHLIIGNHDKRNKRILSEHFQTMVTQAFFEEIGGLKNVFLCHNHRSSVVPDGTEVVLHGHIHGHRLFEYRDGILFINLSMEVWDYHPVSTEQIAEFISVYKRTMAQRES